jgi:SAM-dependent methyltransferase
MASVTSMSREARGHPEGLGAGPYGDAFFDAIDEFSVSSARVVVPIVMQLLGLRSVIDVGCGRGAWLREFHSHGVPTVLGIDGDYVDRDKLLIDRSCFQAMDMERPLPIAEQFDLAVCLEVAEHLPAQSAESLVTFLTSLASCVLFSAAVPGQGGTNHVNEQFPNYWKAKFEASGYVRLDPVRPRVWRDQRVAWWYQQNIYLFVHHREVAARPQLQDELKLCERNCLTLISGDTIPQSLSHLLRLLPRAISNAVRRRITSNMTR